jgi:hypothetical protein
MNWRMSDERGQSAIMSLLFLTVLLATAAAVLDVGSWYRAHRSAQAEADASALAAAQAFPATPANASVLAVQYANKNGGGVTAGDVTLLGNDTVRVDVHRDAPGFFSKVLGIGGVTVHAHAAAKAYRPGEVRWVAPIVVRNTHTKLFGTPGCPCFDQQTTLTLGPQGAPGAFSMLNLVEDDTGTVGTSTMVDWIENGFNGFLNLREYYSDPGAKYNSSQIQDALKDRYGTELLFPVYDVLSGTGSNAQYRVIGWVGFHITDTQASGTSGTITGWFTRYIAEGLDSTDPSGTPDTGVRSISLVD